MVQTVLFSNTLSTQYLVVIIRAIFILSCAFFTGYKSNFFLSGFRVKSIYKSKGSREMERLFLFSSSPTLPPATQIIRSSAFTVIGEVMNEDFVSGSRNHTTFFYYQNLYKIKLGGRVSGSAFEYQLPAINYCCKTLYR